MGAFFIHRREANLALDDVRHLFEKKGFAEPRQFKLGDWQLWLYQKMLVDSANYVQDESRQAVFCTGTVVYRGLGYGASLERILADRMTGKLDQDELLGSFCLLFWDGQEISVLLDRSRTYHVFCNHVKTCLSSSFLAALEAAPSPLPLNRLALCEKLSTGYIVSPDTLVDGIQQVDADVADSFRSQECGIKFLPVAPRPLVELHKDGIKNSIARQIAKLETHFKAMSALHCKCGAHLGMSSGYDSRLVLACSKYLSSPMDIYTHGTKGVHDSEVKVVRQITEALGLRLQQDETRRIENLGSSDMDAMLEDGLLFYDGRCSHNMGAFSEVYTRAYKSRVAMQHQLEWNGLGGEMYRNYYFTPNRPVDLRCWMDRHIYYPFALEAWGSREEYEAMHSRINRKMGRRLDANTDGRISFLLLRRYYSEIRMPDCDAANNDALNQLVFFHTPFMDTRLVAEALSATPYIGCNGAYQAQLIRELSPALAAFTTHYGHTLERVPRRTQLVSWTKCMVPLDIQRRRLKTILLRSSTQTKSKYTALLASTPALKAIGEALRDIAMKGCWQDALIHYAQRPTAIYVGSFITGFQHKLKL